MAPLHSEARPNGLAARGGLAATAAAAKSTMSSVSGTSRMRMPGPQTAVPEVPQPGGQHVSSTRNGTLSCRRQARKHAVRPAAEVCASL